ncbi:MAG: hypothetical protein H6718_11475 [Polyangiaceae bacterium]|nr:hypothetical protein [Polyangiaceae bacterium]
MADKLFARLFTMSRVYEPTLLDGWLGRLEADPTIAPTHAQIGIRRTPYDPVDVRTRVQQYKPVELTRTKAPKYTIHCKQDAWTLSKLYLDLDGPLREPHFEAWWSALNDIASLFQVDYGFIHVDWRTRDTKETPEFSQGLGMDISDLRGYGPGTIFARTWYSPFLVDLIGPQAISRLGHVSKTDTGVTIVDLVEGPPWKATFEDLDAARAKACRVLAEVGLRGDFSKYPRPKPPAWQLDPSWNLKHDKTT